jgi:hypothetical protein
VRAFFSEEHTFEVLSAPRVDQPGYGGTGHRRDRLSDLRSFELKAFLYAFDLLELNGTDLRREPIEVRKAFFGVGRSDAGTNAGPRCLSAEPTSPLPIGNARQSFAGLAEVARATYVVRGDETSADPQSHGVARAAA